MAEGQKKQIFRQQSLDRVSSPEQLTEYIHVTKAGIWAVLTVVILLIVGLFAWSAIGRIETVTDAKASVADGAALITVQNNTTRAVTAGMALRVGDQEFTITSVDVDDLGHTVAYAQVSLADGSYDGKVVLSSVTPISFLISD